MMNKLLIVVFASFVLIVIVEISFYFGIKQQLAQLKNQSAVTSAALKKLKQINPYYQNVFPLAYDESKDRVYIDMPSKSVVLWRQRMAANYASWLSTSMLTKDITESLILTGKLKATIVNVNPNTIRDNERYLYFKLKGQTDVLTDYYFPYNNDNFIKHVQIFRKTGEQEIPIKVSELKKGDTITIEFAQNMIISPNDIDPNVEKIKITKF